MAQPSMKCFGPGTTASVQVGRELTINHVRFDWPTLSWHSAATRGPLSEVMAEVPRDLNVVESSGIPAAMLVYWTHEAPDGSLEFVPALAVRGEPIANPISGQPKYQPKFIPLVANASSN